MGWAGLLGALGQGIGGQMMKDREQERELKIRQQLEEAQQKRQMFLEKYRSDLSYQNQSQLAQEAEGRKIEAASNDFSHHIETTPNGVFGYSADGRSKLLRTLTPEEKDKMEYDRKYRDQVLANQTASTQSLNSSRKIAEENAKALRQQREAEAKLTPEEKEERARRDRVASAAQRLMSSSDFTNSLNLPDKMQEGTPEYMDFLAQQAKMRAEAADKAVYGSTPFKQPTQPQGAIPTREEILAKAQQSLAARPDLKDQIEKLKKQMLAQYGYAE